MENKLPKKKCGTMETKMLEEVTLYNGKKFKPDLPEISENEYVGIFFTGGIESTLVAKMLIEKYGVDRVVFIVLTMDRYSNYAKNAEKAKRVFQDFETRVSRLSGKHIVDMNTEDANNCDEWYGTRVLSDITKKKITRTVGKCNYVFAGYSNIHKEHMEMLEECGWENQIVLREQVEKWLLQENRIDKYPEIKKFMEEQKGALYFVTESVPFTTVKEHYYDTVKPLHLLTKSEACDLYRQYNILDEIAHTISCNQSQYGGYDHCGVCKNCIQRQDGLWDAGITDPTNYVN